MGSHLIRKLANAFLVYFEKNWLWNCPYISRPQCGRRCVDGISVLLTSPEHLEAFRNFLNCWHAKISFSTENEKQNRMPFFMYRLFIKIKHLPLLFTVYHLRVSLVLFRHSLLDASEYAKFGLNYTLNKSLRVNCREINQVTSKHQYLFDKTCQKGLKRSKRSQQNFKNSN